MRISPWRRMINTISLRELDAPVFPKLATLRLRHVLKSKYHLPGWFLSGLTLQQLDSLKIRKQAITRKADFMYDHEAGVADLAAKLGPKLGLDEATQRYFIVIALLHDIGKICVSGINLNRKITDTEKKVGDSAWEIIKMHPIISENIFRELSLGEEYEKVVRHHHEWWNGCFKGYPDRLSGESIPYLSRILTILDSYQAIRAKRPYADKTRSKLEALMEINRGAGLQYDPELAFKIIKMIANDPDIK